MHTGSGEYLDTEDKTTGVRLTGSAITTSKLNLTYEIDKLSFHLNGKKYNKYYGARDSSNGSPNVYTDYKVVDFKTNYKVNDTTDWFFGIENIQNKEMPYNMTSRGTPNDPGERFYYTGMNFTF